MIRLRTVGSSSPPLAWICHRKRRATLGVAALAAWLATPPPGIAYQAIAVADGGSIVGEVVYRGTPPTAATITVTKDPNVCGREKTANSLIVGANKGIRNAVARLLDIRQGKPLPKPRSVTIDQKGCEYSPRILLFPAGSRVMIENNDGILHNTNVTAEINPSFTVAQPKFRRVIERRIDEPEMPMRVRCDVHSWMGAWWISQDHPYYAVTDASGTFALADVPPGHYTLEVWHEVLGKVTQTVTVGPKTTARITLEMTQR